MNAVTLSSGVKTATLSLKKQANQVCENRGEEKILFISYMGAFLETSFTERR